MTPTQSPSRRLVFVNRFYAPDHSATSQILSDVAEALSDRGHDVTVVTSRMSYDASAKYERRETRAGVKVRRIWTTRFGRGSTIGRAFDYLTFYLSVTLSLLFSLSKGDILIAKTDPPMLSIPLGVVARLRGVKLVTWLQDVFPEVATELGVGSSDNFILKAIKALRDRSLRRATMNVAIGECMARAVEAMGVPRGKIIVIENFVDDVAIVRRDDHAPALREEWGFSEDDFIVGYSGNLGRAHDLDTLLDAATLLAPHPQIKFLFVGGGFLRERLTQEIKARGLSNIELRPYQPRERLAESLSVPNFHWASLVPALEGYIVPSKVYGIAAAGRPLLMIGDEAGEIGQMATRHQFGLCAAPGDAERVKAIILELSTSPEDLETLGVNARAFIDQHSSMAKAFERWHQLAIKL